MRNSLITTLISSIIGAPFAAPQGHASEAAERPPTVTVDVTFASLRAELSSASTSQREAGARVAAARGQRRARLPVLPNPTLAVGGSFAPGEDGSELEARLAQELPIFSDRAAGRRAANLELEAAEAELLAATRRDEAALVAALLDWRRARDARDLADVLAQNAEALRDATVARASKGQVAPQRADLARVDALTVADARAEREADVQRASLSICTLLGRLACSLDAAWPDAPVLTIDGALDEAALTREALAARAELRAAESRVAAARAEVAHVRGETRLAPELSLGVARSNEVLGPLSETEWVVSGELSFALPVWDPREGEVQVAQAAVTTAEVARSSVELTIVHEVQEAVASLRAARERAAAWRDVDAGLTSNLADVERGVSLGALDLETALALRDRLAAAARAASVARWSVARREAQLFYLLAREIR